MIEQLTEEKARELKIETCPYIRYPLYSQTAHELRVMGECVLTLNNCPNADINQCKFYKTWRGER